MSLCDVIGILAGNFGFSFEKISELTLREISFILKYKHRTYMQDVKLRGFINLLNIKLANALVSSDKKTHNFNLQNFMKHYETLSEDFMKRPEQKAIENLDKMFGIKNG